VHESPLKIFSTGLDSLSNPGFYFDLRDNLYTRCASDRTQVFIVVASLASRDDQHEFGDAQTDGGVKRWRCIMLAAMLGIGRLFPLIVALALPAWGLARNIQTAALNGAVGSLNSCPARSLLLNFEIDGTGQAVRQVPIWRLQDNAAFFFTAGMAIDADGSPNAYNPEDTGLDDLSNAGQPGHWDGIIADDEGNPVVQGPDDPFPGYYISCTALSDRTKGRIDPTRYVDASKIPYIALPGELARDSGARLGDLAVVVNTRNGKFSYAIFADIGRLGEGSIALADNLGIWSDARNGGRWRGVLYLVFPGSGEHRPLAVEEINERAEKMFHDWGGVQHIRSCADEAPENPPFSFQ
jgi:hypothetical protein